MKIFNLLNLHKRIVVIILSVIFIALMLFPIGTVVVENADGTSSQAQLSITNISSKIDSIKKTYSIENLSIKDIDRNNPADEIQQARIVIYDIVNNCDYSVLMLSLTIVLVVLATMVIYVKPNSIVGLLLFGGSVVTLVLTSAFGIAGINILNKNVEIVKTFYGVDPNFQGFSLSTNSYYFFLIAFLALIILVNVVLRKPKNENNESEKLTKAILFCCAVISVLMVGFITFFLFYKGIPTISTIGVKEFLFSSNWTPKPTDGSEPHFGILNMILTSTAGTFGAIVIGVPIGILVAIFISQLTPPKVGGVLLETTNLLAGIPSVIYGAVGAIVLVPFIQKYVPDLSHGGAPLSTGKILLSAIIVLAIMVLPTIISVTTTSLNAVPKTFMEASLALGLTKEASVFKVLIPAARNGIMTGVMLGLGRAIGEAMAIILVSGNGTGFPNLFSSARFLTTGIVAEMGYADGLHRDALFAIGLVLFVFILIINAIFKALIAKAGEKYEQ